MSRVANTDRAIKIEEKIKQATPVLPLPIVKSNTKSFSLVYVFIKYSNKSTGF